MPEYILVVPYVETIYNLSVDVINKGLKPTYPTAVPIVPEFYPDAYTEKPLLFVYAVRTLFPSLD